MDRKEIARETLDIMRQGYYDIVAEGEKRISVKDGLEWSVRHSVLITPGMGEEILSEYEGSNPGGIRKEDGNDKSETEKNRTLQGSRVENISTVDAIRMVSAEGREKIGVLNFASAKNPGGGFLNGAMAQEESLAASGTLYRTQTANEEYYRANRAQRSMMYTDYGIYSPDVIFFRDGSFHLVTDPVKASVLTMPAVNMRQVKVKGEDVWEAERVMRRRMKLALAVFAKQGAKNLILGAYGCGVFGNDPFEVAQWWKELMEEGFGRCFDSVFYAVLDLSKGQKCIKAFRQVFEENC